MKRFLTVFIALMLLLSSCGTPPTEPTQSPTPEAAPSPPAATEEIAIETQRPAIRTVSLEDLPNYIPELGFELESVWRAEAFGFNGAGLLYMGREEDGERRARLYFYDFPQKTGVLSAFSLELLLRSDGEKYDFCLSQEYDALSSYFSRFSGTAEEDGEKLQMSYSDIAIDLEPEERLEIFIREKGTYYISPYEDPSQYLPGDGTQYSLENRMRYLPLEFVRLSEEEANKAMYDMPLFRDEISLPIARTSTANGIRRVFGDVEISFGEINLSYYYVDMPSFHMYGHYWIDDTGTGNYTLDGAISSGDDFPVTARGIKIGQSLYEVAARFPGSENILDNSDDYEKEYIIILLFGREEQGGIFGTAYYREGYLTQLIYSFDGEAVKLHFDSDGKLERFHWFEL